MLDIFALSSKISEALNERKFCAIFERRKRLHVFGRRAQDTYTYNKVLSNTLEDNSIHPN